MRPERRCALPPVRQAPSAARNAPRAPWQTLTMLSSGARAGRADQQRWRRWRRCQLDRQEPRVGNQGRDGCANGVVQAAAVGVVSAAGSGDSPARCSPRPTRHLRTRFAFRPLASATAAIDAPGSLHAASTAVFNRALCTRRTWDLGCIGVHQSIRWTPSLPRNHRLARSVGWTLTHHHPRQG